MTNYIDINSITKIYKLNEKIEVKALNNVSFSLEEKGLVFVVGKSGCGKSTLLNILGGLDKPTEGTVSIDSILVDYSKEKNLDKHRNEDIGFIFQDHHLIDSFTIKENMKMPLLIQNQTISDEKIDEVLDLVDLKEFKDRFPNEISGGQRQRVSIARALIKNPKIILADEPTGNLDSSTSKQIFELLKEISKEKLIIVVTHDLDSAYVYGDRILELRDGELVSDRLKVSDFSLDVIKEKYEAEVNKSYKQNDKEYKAPENLISKSNEYKSKLSFKDAFNIMLSWFKKGLTPMLISVFILSLALTAFGIFNNIRSYNSKSAIKTTLEKNDIGTAILLNTTIDEENMSLNKDNLFTKDKIEFVADNFNDVFNGYMISTNLNKFVEDKNNIYDTKINGVCELGDEINESQLSKFYHSKLVLGTYPKHNNNAIEILISDYLADSLSYFGANFTNGTYYPNTPLELLIGKTFEYNVFSFKIVGIYECNYSPVYKTVEEYDKNNSELTYSLNYIYPIVLTNNNSIKNFATKSPLFQIESELKSLEDEVYISYNSTIIGINTIEELNAISTANDIEIKFSSGFTSENLSQSQVIISFSRYLDIFNKYEYDNEGVLISTFDNLNSEDITNLEIMQKINDEISYFSVIGIYDDTNYNSEVMICNNKIKDRYIEDTIVTTNLFITIDNSKSFVNKLSKFADDNNMTIFTAFSEKLFYFDKLFSLLMNVINGITIIVLVFVVLLLSVVISKNIREKEKDIGILRAIGAGSSDLIKIFMFNDIFYIVISSVLSLVFYIIGCGVFNNSISNNLSVKMSVISGDIISVLLMFITSFIVVVISSLRPILKYTKIPPINVIKGLE